MRPRAGAAVHARKRFSRSLAGSVALLAILSASLGAATASARAPPPAPVIAATSPDATPGCGGLGTCALYTISLPDAWLNSTRAPDDAVDWFACAPHATTTDTCRENSNAVNNDTESGFYAATFYQANCGGNYTLNGGGVYRGSALQWRAQYILPNGTPDSALGSPLETPARACSANDADAITRFPAPRGFTVTWNATSIRFSWEHVNDDALNYSAWWWSNTTPGHVQQTFPAPNGFELVGQPKPRPHLGVSRYTWDYDCYAFAFGDGPCPDLTSIATSHNETSHPLVKTYYWLMNRDGQYMDTSAQSCVLVADFANQTSGTATCSKVTTGATASLDLWAFLRIVRGVFPAVICAFTVVLFATWLFDIPDLFNKRPPPRPPQ